MCGHHYEFFSQLARIFNSNQSRSVILCGNVYDLFYNGSEYVPLIPFLCRKTATPGLTRVVYELNGPVRILDNPEQLKKRWIAWKTGENVDRLLLRELRKKGPTELERLAGQFDQLLLDAIGNPTLALELLRQLTICSRSTRHEGSLLILIEAADMLLPAGSGDVASLADRQLQRVSIVQDWFSDPGFMNGRDSVCLIAESRSLVHPRVSRLPQVLPVEIPSPCQGDRLHYIEMFYSTAERAPELWTSHRELATLTAGLSIHAVRQLLVGSAYQNGRLMPSDVIAKVEQFIQAQLGEDVVEFKKPTHTLDDVVGFRRLKQFLRSELMPRFMAPPDRALGGAAVAGPIGGGKTFIFEAMAAELDVPVLVLKNIRSQWFGQTDVIFERLRRVVEALDKVLIFVDEADTQFGGVSPDVHPTERRLTGKIQAMMADPQLRGQVIWLLMTARIHLLSPDLRRPGRVGDLIIPVLDPEGEDRRDFLRWVLRAVMPEPTGEAVERLDGLTQGYSAAAFASLRHQLRARQPTTLEEITEIVRDQLPPAIGATRRYQTLQALVNCTRRSLLPDPTVSDQERAGWLEEIRHLEAQGIEGR
ncbi:MAG TPA: ATP-binding protein [Planctomycetaceae bacterium]|nr:ATP-binding protein [Planctomycetaceae bacterium]HIQ22163.1 ATP-binding protein [Planctomycetota bacterium]